MNVRSTGLITEHAPPAGMDPGCPTLKMDPCHEKKIKDAWITFMAYANKGTDILPQEERKVAKQIQYLQRKIEKDIDKGAIISGALAGTSALTSAIPLGAGVPASMVLSFVANHKGFVDSTRIGFKYAEVCDQRQDLFQETERFFKSLAIRLLDRYIKSQRKNQAYLLQREHECKGSLLEEDEKARMEAESPELRKLSKSLLTNLPNLTRSPFFKPEEMEAVLIPLKEVCEYIHGQRKQFSVEGLHNELITMRTHYALKLTQRLIRQGEQEAEVQRDKIHKLEEDTRQLQDRLKETGADYKEKYKARYKEKYKAKYRERYHRLKKEKVPETIDKAA